MKPAWLVGNKLFFSGLSFLFFPDGLDRGERLKEGQPQTHLHT